MNPTAASFMPASDGSTATVASSPDARLRTMARKALANTGYAPLSSLECQVYDGVVILRGQVASYYLKQVAQEAVRRLGLNGRIDNRVTVVYQ